MTTSTNIASTNWSGAVLTAASRESFSTVSAEWVVPTVSQVPIKGVTTSDVSEWVGLDGYNSADVCQAGILETVQTSVHGGTRISCSAFDEWYPAGSNSISASSFHVNPGDTIKVTVETTGVGATKASFVFDDVTTGKIYDSSDGAKRDQPERQQRRIRCRNARMDQRQPRIATALEQFSQLACRVPECQCDLSKRRGCRPLIRPIDWDVHGRSPGFLWLRSGSLWQHPGEVRYSQGDRESLLAQHLIG